MKRFAVAIYSVNDEENIVFVVDARNSVGAMIVAHDKYCKKKGIDEELISVGSIETIINYLLDFDIIMSKPVEV